MNKSIIIALSIFALLLLWLASGLITGNGGNNENGSAEPTAREEGESSLLSVRVRRQRAQPVVREVIIHGKTDAARKVEIKAETAGRKAWDPAALCAAGSQIRRSLGVTDAGFGSRRCRRWAGR